MPKFFILTLFKESYLLLTNSYGFLVHPYLTLSRLRRDRSQTAIFFSLWFGGWLGILLIAGLGFLISWFLPQFNLLKSIGFGISGLGAIFLLFFTGYLAYWLMIWKKFKNG